MRNCVAYSKEGPITHYPDCHLTKDQIKLRNRILKNSDNNISCQNCGSIKEKLLKCSGCHNVYYCSKEC